MRPTPTPQPENGTPEMDNFPATGPPLCELTPYEKLLLKQAPWWQNNLSPFFTWILLAGFLVLPGSFSTLETIETSSGNIKKVLHAIENLPLYVPSFESEKKTTFRCFSNVWGSTNRLVIAYGCCAFGVCGMCFLWWCQSDNCVWLLRHVFIPGMLNGLSGLVSTLINVYATHNGVLGAPSIATLAVTGVCIVICGFLATFYWLSVLRPLFRDHQKRERLRERNALEEIDPGKTPPV